MREIGRNVLIVIAVLIALAILGLIAQRLVFTPVEESSAATWHGATDKTVYEKGHFSHRKRHALRRSHYYWNRGKMQKARRWKHRVGRIHRIPYWQKAYRRLRWKQFPVWQEGCGRGAGAIRAGDAILDDDMYRVYWSQKVCKRHNKITRVQRMNVRAEVTGWGSFLGWNNEGSCCRSGDYKSWGGVSKGAHVSRVSQLVRACTPVPTGCGFPDTRRYEGRILFRANKSWVFAWARH